MSENPTIAASSSSEVSDQPFRLLGVDPTATREQVRSAFELARQQGFASEQVLVTAREVLLDPTRRLPYELAYPLGHPVSELDEWHRLVLEDTPSERLLAHAAAFTPLSQANFFAFVAGHRAAEAQLLYAMINAYGRIELTNVYDQLKTARRLGEYPPPPLHLVSEGLKSQFDIDCRRAISAYDQIDQASEAVVGCVKKVLAVGERYQANALSRLLAAYHNATLESQRSSLAEVEAACEEVEGNAEQHGIADTLWVALDRWIAVCRPLLMYESRARALDEPLQTPLARLRSLIVDLALNAHYERAIELAALSKEKLSLISASAQLLDEAAIPAELAVRTRRARELSSRAAPVDLPHTTAPIAKNVGSRISGKRSTVFAAAALAVFCAALLLFAFDQPRLIVANMLARSFPQKPASAALALADDEVAPAVGSQQHLTLANLRYCKFQEERIRLIKPAVKTAEDTRAFNLLVVDYNSRCSDFLYRDSDVSIVQIELIKNRERFAAEAEQIISGWHSLRQTSK
jgi:hypothetical protein